MAEFEFAGMTFRGGKMVAILTALSTAGGAMWGGFEFYKDYMDMKEIIANIDTDAIAARNDVIETKLEEAIDYTRDIKNDLRDDILRVERVAEDASRRTKDTQTEIDNRLRIIEDLNRETEKDVRNTMRETEGRLDAAMRRLDEDLHRKLQEALDNPLSK
jgi:hypothetical protein